MGKRAEGGAEVEGGRPPDRDRPVPGARLQHGAVRVPHVLRVIPPERAQPPVDGYEEDRSGRQVHGPAVQGGGETRRSSPGTPRRTTTTSTAGDGVDDPERDFGDADAGVSQPAVLERPLDLADPAGPHGRLGLEHLMGCWSIWKFAQNKANAQKFLIDLLNAGKQATIQSQLYNFPTSRRRSLSRQSASSLRPTRTSRRGSTRS